MAPLRLVVPKTLAAADDDGRPLAHLEGFLEPLGPFMALPRGGAHALLRLRKLAPFVGNRGQPSPGSPVRKCPCMVRHSIDARVRTRSVAVCWTLRLQQA